MGYSKSWITFIFNLSKVVFDSRNGIFEKLDYFHFQFVKGCTLPSSVRPQRVGGTGARDACSMSVLQHHIYLYICQNDMQCM